MQRSALIALAALFSLAGCSAYDPLTDRCLRKQIGHPIPEASAVKVTFLGTSTLVIQDTETTLLVDGFLSRPGKIRTAIGGIKPIPRIVMDELSAAGVKKIDAVLVGHAHHDHALDATLIADEFKATAYGSASYGMLYEGSRDKGRKRSFVPIGREGDTKKIGRFIVHFIPSVHVAPDSLVQRLIAGPIKKPFKPPAHFTRYKCGEVFALYIEHQDAARRKVTERIAVTTTAGALPDKLTEREAPSVMFLSVGYLSKASADTQHAYWANTVGAPNPDVVVVPVHWDDFTVKLSKGLKPATGLLGSTVKVMDFVKEKGKVHKLRVLDLRESILISNTEVYCPEPLNRAEYPSTKECD